MAALLRLWQASLLAYLAVTAGRAVLICPTTLFLRRTRETLPWSWSAVLTWGGLHGGLSMVLALDQVDWDLLSNCGKRSQAARQFVALQLAVTGPAVEAQIWAARDFCR